MADPRDDQRRLTEFETRLAFQEHALQELNDTVVRQQAQTDRLGRALKEAQARLRQVFPPVAGHADETPPPHY